MKPGWKPEEVPTLALAFIGDAVWHVHVRNHVMNRGVRRPNDLHRAATSYARASAQAEALARLMDELTPAEQAIVKRGRNAKTTRMGKNAEMIDYRHSTGFEALLGYVHGQGDTDRLEYLCTRALSILDEGSGAGHAAKQKNEYAGDGGPGKRNADTETERT